MQTYTTTKQGFAKIRRDTIRRSILLLSSILGIFSGWQIWKIKVSGEGNLTSLFIILVILVGANIFTIRKTIIQQREIWNSIEISLGDDYISRQQLRIPPVRIDRREITAIEEHKSGLLIKTADKGCTIVVPSQLEQADYLEIKEALTNWNGREIAAATHDKKDLGVAISYCIAFVILLVSFNIWLNFILGIALIAYNVYTNKLIQSSVAIDPQYKKTYKRVFAFTIFIVLINTFGKMYMLSGIKRFQEKVDESSHAVLLNTHIASRNIYRQN